MGLYVSHLKNLPYEHRSLYIYLLDYGWPQGPYEKIFRENFQALSRRASDTGSIIIASDRGIHFANEVLDWHHIAGLDAEKILPAILITKTHPNYFLEANGQQGPDAQSLGDIVLIPLKSVCTSPDDFISAMETVFADLNRGLEITNFSLAEYSIYPKASDVEEPTRGLGQRIGKSFILQPNLGGVGIDLKKLFSKRRD